MSSAAALSSPGRRRGSRTPGSLAPPAFRPGQDTTRALTDWGLDKCQS